MRLSSSRATALTHRPQQDFPLWDKAGTRPSLDLQFADRMDLVDATTGSNLVDHTRASSGTYVGSDGLIKRAVTNLVLQSEDFSTFWTKDASSVLTTNVASAPNGLITADKFSVGTSSFAQIAQQVTSTASLTHSFSIYAKADGVGFIQLRVRNTGATTNYFRAIFNLTTGAVTSAIRNGTGSVISATAISVGGGWWRCTLTGIADTAGTSVQPLAILTVDANGTVATSSNSAATDGVLFWGAQLEQSSTVGEYIPTTSTINSAPRFDHNPTTGESLGLLVEESRTNLLLQSEDFSTTWTTTRASISSDVAIAPNGSTTADKLAEDATASSTHVTTQSGLSFTSGVIYTFSCYAKAGERQSIRLSFPSAAFTTNIYGHFNLSAGTVTTASAEVAASIQALGDSWYRCIVSATATTTATGNTTIFLGEDAATASVSFDGDGTSGIYLWGAQLEAGSFPTSHIPTTDSAVTRAADVASISGSNFSSWYRQDEGTVFADALRGTDVEATIATLSIGATTQDRIQIHSTTASEYRVTYRTGNVEQAALLLSSSTNTPKVAALIKANDLASCVNGGALSTDTSATLAAYDTLHIGVRSDASTHWNSTIRRLTYWPQRLPNETLQTITQ